MLDLKAKQVMSKDTPVLNFDATVAEAVEYFRAHKVSFAVVQATPERFQGVLTEGGLMRVYLRYRSRPQQDTLILYRDLFEPAQLIHEDESFTEVFKKLVAAVENRVFVINTDSAVIGHITVKDILPYLQQQNQTGAVRAPKVQEDLDLYENFFTQSPFMMHSVNPEGNIRMANIILHQVLGYEYGSLVGQAVFNIYPKDVIDKVKESLNQIITGKDFKVVKGQMVHKNGKLIEMEMVSRALLDPHGAVIGTVTVSRPQDMAYLLRCLPPTKF